MSVADPHLMLAFEGAEVPDWLKRRLEESPPAGVTLFREEKKESGEFLLGDGGSTATMPTEEPAETDTETAASAEEE